jgi:S1-C subfamily serine protease
MPPPHARGGDLSLSATMLAQAQRGLVLVDSVTAGAGAWGTGAVLSSTSRIIVTNAHVVDSFPPNAKLRAWMCT